MARADLKKTQTRLQTAGYYTGTIDGKYGPKTDAAINAVLNKYLPETISTKPPDTITEYPPDDYQLSENFKLREFYYGGQKVPLSIINNLVTLCLTVLEPFRAKLNDKARELKKITTADNPIAVTIKSGYRPKPASGDSMHHIAASDIIWDYNMVSKADGQCILIDMYKAGTIGGLGLSAKSATSNHVDLRQMFDYANNKYIWGYGNKNNYAPEVIAKLKEYGYWDRLLMYA